jgi:hypothetical protein
MRLFKFIRMKFVKHFKGGRASYESLETSGLRTKNTSTVLSKLCLCFPTSTRK